MWLQAVLTRDDLARFLGQMTPVRFRLGPERSDRFLYLGKPTELELVPNTGIRIRTRARVRWDLAGIRVPVVIKSLSVMLSPQVVRRDRRDVLLFALAIEEADLSALPAFLDRSVVSLVNRAIENEQSSFAWDFTKTLDWHIPLPAIMGPVHTLDLRASWGEVRITRQALTLAVSFRTKTHRTAKAA